MLPLPDLLYPRPTAAVDERLLEELLELSFLGSDKGQRLADVLQAVRLPETTWRADFFAEGLFLEAVVEEVFRLPRERRTFPLHRRFLLRVLSHPPLDLDTIRFRQAVLRELEGDPEMRRRATRLHRELFDLLALFKTPGAGMRLDLAGYRLDALRQAKRVVDLMVDDFAGAESGLRRLHEVGLEIQGSREYAILASLLDHEEYLSELTLRVRLGADGRIRRLTLEELADNTANPYHRRPLRRWLDRLRIAWRGLDLDRREVVNRLILSVFHEISPALQTILQTLGHLELYLGALTFADRVREMGLEVCLPDFTADGDDRDGGEAGRLELVRLFNPLLLRQAIRPVPCDVTPRHPHPTVVVTGPNSGGKTRMLQAVGLAQLLGQSGLFVPARRARLPLVPGLFVSLVEHTTADQVEGRLGAELTRIRQLFEEVRPGAMILLDELCSGTNPSEAVEIVATVLDLLRGLDPVAFITTHFLDYTKELAADPPGPGVEFLRAATTDDHVPTYRFVPGVADTSLAADTARRMGVTFDDLADLLTRRFGVRRDETREPAETG